MTLSQIIRGSRWEDVLLYIKKFNSSRGFLTKLIIELCEPMFRELQQIEPEGEGMRITLARMKDRFGECDRNYHQFDAYVYIEAEQKIYGYMWSHYLGAEVEDLGDNNNAYRVNYDPDEDDRTRAERYRMPDAAIVANVILHLYIHGYSQAEAEDNIKRRMADELLGYNTYCIHQLTEPEWLARAHHILTRSTRNAEVVDRFLNGVQEDTLFCFTAHFCTNYGWSKQYSSVATRAFEERILHFHHRALMVIAYPPAFAMSSKVTSTIKHLMFVAWPMETVFVEDDTISNHIRVEVYAY